MRFLSRYLQIANSFLYKQPQCRFD